MNDCILICSVLTGRGDLFDTFRDRLVSEFGAIELESETFIFDYTDYYEDEMGPDLTRRLYSFQKLIHPETIADIKLRTIELEAEMTAAVKADVARVVNFDPGYVGPLKLVLATTKDRGHRIYLRDTIYAEVTLQHISGTFQALPSTYPDYASPEYRKFFEAVRERLNFRGQDTLHG